MRRIAAAILGLVLTATPAWAVGPVIGTNCTFVWTAPTTNVDGSAITGVITYDLALVTSVAQPLTPPAAPTLTGINGVDTTVLPAPPCRTLASGQWWVYVRTVENYGGSLSPSVWTAATPFVLGIPNPPTSVIVK
jgi:hypothetical protein